MRQNEAIKLQKRRRVKELLRAGSRQLAAMKAEIRRSSPELGTNLAKRLAQQRQRAAVRALVSRELQAPQHGN